MLQVIGTFLNKPIPKELGFEVILNLAGIARTPLVTFDIIFVGKIGWSKFMVGFN